VSTLSNGDWNGIETQGHRSRVRVGVEYCLAVETARFIVTLSAARYRSEACGLAGPRPAAESSACGRG